MTKLMKDVFELPMICEDGDGYIYSNDLRYSIKFDDTDLNCMDQKKAVSKAINSHDTLTEQNKELVEALKKLLDVTDKLGDQYSCDNPDVDVQLIMDAQEVGNEAIELLAKHRESDK